MKLLCYSLFTLLFVVSPQSFSKTTKSLTLPPNSHALDAVIHNVRSIYRHNDRIWLGTLNQSFIVQTPFHGFKPDEFATFGKHTDSTRLALPKNLQSGDWQGVVLIDNLLYLFDGKQISLSALTLNLKDEKLDLVNTQTIPWDKVKPAKGHRYSQQDFRREMAKDVSPKFTSFIPDANHWLGKKQPQYFASTALPGFPVITLNCRNADQLTCTVDRACTVKGLDLRGSKISGLATTRHSRHMLLSDQVKHQVHVFKFNSCDDIRYLRSMEVDKKIKELTSIYIDDNNWLWITSSRNDDYHNASAYAWESW